MEQFSTTIGTVSRQILDNFTKKEERDGITVWDLRENIEWQHHIILDSYVNSLPTPEAYSSAFKVLLEIFVASNPEEATEFIYDIDTTDEVSELTAWLHSSPENVAYLNQALADYQPESGADALSLAYKLYLQEIGENMIQSINHYISTLEVYEQELN